MLSTTMSGKGFSQVVRKTCACFPSGCLGSFGPVQTTREVFKGLRPLAGTMESHASSPSLISRVRVVGRVSPHHLNPWFQSV